MLGVDYTILTLTICRCPRTLVREIRYQGNLVGSPYQTTVSNRTAASMTASS